MKYIKIDVRCIGCKELIPKPSDADLELWRLGINVHNDVDCVRKAESRLQAAHGRA